MPLTQFANIRLLIAVPHSVYMTAKERQQYLSDGALFFLFKSHIIHMQPS